MRDFACNNYPVFLFHFLFDTVVVLTKFTQSHTQATDVWEVPGS